MLDAYIPCVIASLGEASSYNEVALLNETGSLNEAAILTMRQIVQDLKKQYHILSSK